MHLFLKFIFGIELYMFRTVSLSIIRMEHPDPASKQSAKPVWRLLIAVYSAKHLMMDRETVRNM
jgi:hypothetical protein